MIINWAHVAPTIVAAFLASLVEFVEALTVVLAVGAVRGWRGALGGTGIALLLLALLVAMLGPAMVRIPQEIVQLGLGSLLLLFGMRWLRKAILRVAGVIPLHDEEDAYAKESAALRALGSFSQGWDRVAVATSFKITMVEGIEVVFIVIAMGGIRRGLLLPASLGALAALMIHDKGQLSSSVATVDAGVLIDVGKHTGADRVLALDAHFHRGIFIDDVIGIEGQKPVDVGLGVEALAVEVARLDPVAVDQQQLANPAASQRPS